MPPPEKHELFGTDWKEPCSTCRKLSREPPRGESSTLKSLSPKRSESKRKKTEAKLREN